MTDGNEPVIPLSCMGGGGGGSSTRRRAEGAMRASIRVAGESQPPKRRRRGGVASRRQAPSALRETLIHRVGTGVQFQGIAKNGNAPLRYEWNFGDGSTATGQTVTHTYRNAGGYTVVLTVGEGNRRAVHALSRIEVRE